MTRCAPRAAALCAVATIFASGCSVTRLQRENAHLQRTVESLRAQIEQLRSEKREGAPVELERVDRFTVGLAAAQESFDDQAFVELLMHSLESGAQRRGFQVVREGDPREVEKIRGMLVQQYLAAEEIPIRISNLGYKLEEAGREFKIGGRVVPRQGARIARASAGSAAHVTYPGELDAVLRRDAQGRYSVDYEELGGGHGRIPIQLRDVEITAADEEAKFARQGDLTFNWRLDLAKVVVYRVSGYQGDIGAFLRNMRYPTISSSISQYQTLRDSVFLFGYGNYQTTLVQQIRTPPYISGVEVLPIDEQTFRDLRGGIAEEEILERVGRRGRWIPCEFVDFEGGQRIWKRPPTVPFPFVSRQVSDQKLEVFYAKYDVNGSVLVGNFDRDGGESR